MADAAGTPYVLITGIGGLIGTQVAEALYPDYSVIGIDRKEEDNLPTHVPYDYLPVDLTDDADTTRVLATVREKTGGRLASVIHLAAYYDFAGEPSPLYEALTAGVPTGLFELPEGSGGRIAQGLQQLLTDGLVTPFAQRPALAQAARPQLWEADRAARWLLHRLFPEISLSESAP